MLSALVGLLGLYGLLHAAAILHRKKNELQMLMKGPNKMILTVSDVSFTDAAKDKKAKTALQEWYKFIFFINISIYI